MPAQRTQEPAEPVVSLNRAKQHLRVSHTEEDAYIYGLIQAATDYCEAFCSRGFITQTWVYTNFCFPSQIRLPRFPVASVSSVKYYDTDNVLQTLDPSEYIVSLYNQPCLVAPAVDSQWPDITPRPDAVQVEFVVGVSASSVAYAIRSSVLLLVGHLYENREESTPLKLQSLPMGIESLLSPYRTWA